MIRARFADLIDRAPGRSEFALRLGFVSTITMLIAQNYQTPDAALSAYVAFFMLKPDRATSILTSVVLFVLISIVIAFLLLIAALALDEPPLRVAVMGVLSVVMLFLASASKLKPFAATIGLVLIYALDVIGMAPDGELATRALLYVWLLIAIPAGVAVATNLLVGPSPRRLAERAILERLRAAQTLLLQPDERSRRHAMSLRGQGCEGNLAMLRLARLERVTSGSHLAALDQATRSTETMLMLAEMIDREPGMPARWRASTAAMIGEIAAIIGRGRYPVGIEPVGREGPLPGRIGLLADDWDAVLVDFASSVARAAPAATDAPHGFFVPDAFGNPEHVRYAVKGTIAALGCYLFYSLTNWPGIHTCLITCYIVALDTTAETIEKLTLRIVGALVGAAAGLAAIIWLTPEIDRIGGLLLLVFGGAWAGAWIAGGGPRIAYAGFQLTYAFFLCVVQGAGPGFDLTVARDRVIGILIGNAAIYLMFVWIWPVSIARRIDREIARISRDLAGIARLDDHAARRAALTMAHPRTAQAEVQLDIAGYEPTRMRPDPAWFDQRTELLGTLSKSEMILLLCDDRAQLDREAARLGTLAAPLERDDVPDRSSTGSTEKGAARAQ